MKPLLKYTSDLAHIFVVLLISLFLIHCLQTFSIETARIFRDRPQDQPADPAQRSIMFLPDGTLHQIHTVKVPNYPGQTTEEIYDANNTLIRRRPASDTPNPSYLSFAGHLNRSYDRGTLNSRYTITPEFSKTFDVPVIINGTLQEIWRYDRRRQIFVGHDRSGAALGCLGQQGLQHNKVSATGLGHLVRFQSWWSREQGKQKLLWLTQHHLYDIDVKTRKVNRLVNKSNSHLEIMWIQAWYDLDRDERGYVDPNIYRPLILCRARDNTYHLVLREPNQVITFSPPDEWNQWADNTFQFSATKKDLFLKRTWVEFLAYPQDAFSPDTHNQWLQEYLATKKQHWTELYRIDAQGNLDMVNQGGWRETQVDTNLHLIDKGKWNVFRMVNTLSPGLYNWIITAISPQDFQTVYRNSEANSLSHALMETISMFCPAGTWDYLILSMIMTAIVFWHGRSRLILRKRLIFWLVFTFCFNLVGLLTYLALNHTSVIVCPVCGKKRSLEQDACPRCSAPLPTPVPADPHLIMN